MNPERRTAAVLIALGVAAVLLIGGFVVGFAAGHHRAHDTRFGPVFGGGVVRPYGGPEGQNPGFPQFGPRHGRPNAPGPLPSGAPTPTPSRTS